MCVCVCQSESWLWKERDRLEVDKAELQEHRDNMEQDRQLVMEAAKKLDREACQHSALDAKVFTSHFLCLYTETDV